MNTINHFLLITCLSTGIPILAAEPTPGAPTNEAPSAPATAIQPSTGQPQPAPTAAPEAATNAAATPPGSRRRYERRRGYQRGHRHQRSRRHERRRARRWSWKTAPTACA